MDHGTVSSKTLQQTGSLSARVNLNAERALAIPCPKCKQPAGGWCRTAKGQKLPELHAGRMFASIPAAPASAAQPEESTVSKSKLQATTAKNRREVGSRPAAGKPLPKKPDLKAVNGGKSLPPTHPAIRGADKATRDANAATRKSERAEKPKSKSAIVHDMLTSAKGATRKELSDATGWPSVNLTVAAARADMVIEEDEKTGRVKLVAKPAKQGR